MSRKLIQALATAPIFAAPFARAQTYVASVLYQLTPSPGLPYAYAIFSDNTGNTIANSWPGRPGGTVNQAIYWPGSSSSVVLNPGTAGPTYIDSVQGSQQVGQYDGYAYLWTGTAASAINLNPFTGPNEARNSEATGTDGTQQVGYADGLGGNGAVLWNGTASSMVNLGPSHMTSEAVATDGSQQIGNVTPSSGNANAALWSGTAASFVNLNPSGWVASMAYDVAGGQQVGAGETPGTNPNLAFDNTNFHALLWTGTAASFVDLDPNGYLESQAFGTNGTQQVGWGLNSADSTDDALVWKGSLNSYVDLEGFLPSADKWSGSTADSISANGNIFGWAYDPSGNYYAVEWSPVAVPEPTTLALISFVGTVLISRRRRLPRHS